MYKIERHPILDIPEREVVEFMFEGCRFGKKKYSFFIAILFFIIIPLSIRSQSGYVEKYSSLKGDQLISRVTSNGQYRITCYHSNHDIANFVVTYGDVSKNYPSSNYVSNNLFNPNPVLNYGYIVRDMKVVGDTCWICGSYWRETGEWIYNLQGQAIWEIEYKGFVGFLILSSMAGGECPIWYITIPNINYLNKMIVYPNGLAAIGESGSDKGLYVELTRNDNAQWSYKLGRTTYSEEVFRDISYAGGKIVVLSRFNNPQHVMFYKHGIGLRYGTPGSFISTSQQLYSYSTRYVDGTSDLDFDPEAPLVLDKTHIAGGVAVGYICNPTVQMDTYRGRLVYFIFDAENDHQPECIISKVGQTYMTIKDISSIALNKCVVLLEDSIGNSVFRFSQFQGCAYEKILSLSGPQMISVSTFVSPLNDMGFFSGGHYPSLQKRISCMYEPRIFARLNSWSLDNCAIKTIGGSDSYLSSYQNPSLDYVMELTLLDTANVKTAKFYPNSGTSTQECADAN